MENRFYDVVWRETPKKSTPKIEECLEKQEYFEAEEIGQEYYQEEKKEHVAITKAELIRGSQWFRTSSYTIKEIPYKITLPLNITEVFTIKTIVTNTDEPVTMYDPLKFVPPEKKPKKSLSEEHLWGPHVHLMNLDLEDENEILIFVHRWGLLGLWREDSYKNLPPDEFPPYPPDTFSPLVKQQLAALSKKEIWYNVEKKGPSIPYELRWAEPLAYFKQAARDFQEMVKILKEADPLSEDNKQISANLDANNKLQEILQGVSPKAYIHKGEGKLFWHYDSLYKAIYLLTALEWTAGKYGFRRCAYKKCGGFFVPKTDRDIYCSTSCSGKQRRNKNYHSMERPKKILIKKLFKQYPNLNSDKVEKKINQLLRHGMDFKEIENEIISIINKTKK